jgi:hypothetical protein
MSSVSFLRVLSPSYKESQPKVTPEKPGEGSILAVCGAQDITVSASAYNTLALV